jgi:transcriptional regulator with XRE-family HTH domain
MREGSARRWSSCDGHSVDEVVERAAECLGDALGDRQSRVGAALVASDLPLGDAHELSEPGPGEPGGLALGAENLGRMRHGRSKSTTYESQCQDLSVTMACVFAERLRQAIDERGWTQNQAGRYLGVSGKQIGRYLDGAQPTLPVAARFAQRLGVTLDELAGRAAPTASQRPRKIYIVIDGEAWAGRMLPGRAGLEELEIGLREAWAAWEDHGRAEQPPGTHEATP